MVHIASPPMQLQLLTEEGGVITSGAASGGLFFTGDFLDPMTSWTPPVALIFLTFCACEGAGLAAAVFTSSLHSNNKLFHSNNKFHKHHLQHQTSTEMDSDHTMLIVSGKFCWYVSTYSIPVALVQTLCYLQYLIACSVEVWMVLWPL